MKFVWIQKSVVECWFYDVMNVYQKVVMMSYRPYYVTGVYYNNVGMVAIGNTGQAKG